MFDVLKGALYQTELSRLSPATGFEPATSPLGNSTTELYKIKEITYSWNRTNVPPP